MTFNLSGAKAEHESPLVDYEEKYETISDKDEKGFLH